MREVNFSIPSVNKASVNITTTLYDRRALDCTSTLPLINSLNHLAYLTTSSARIRDILTVDGGIEQLVCILKTGRSKDLMEMWKWNLAFQCIVNIGVRGSENVRTRVVEADMVPVIATILDNYIRVVDKIRASSETEPSRSSRTHKPTSSRPRDHPSRSFFDRGSSNSEHRTTRRQPPPSIEIPHPYSQDIQQRETSAVEITPSPQVILTSPPERTTFSRDAHSHHPFDERHQNAGHRHRFMHPLATAVPSMDSADGFVLRPVQDNERLPSMVPSLQTGIISQPESPTTPLVAVAPQNLSQLNVRPRRRPSVRQQPSTSGESDDAQADGEDITMGDDDQVEPNVTEPIVSDGGMEIEDIGEQDGILDDSTNAHGLTMQNPSETPTAETFNISHRSIVDDSTVNIPAQPRNDTLGIPPARPTANPPPSVQQNPYPFYLRDRTASPAVLTAMPRDEDVLMALQLLAYVSKYCNLRSYFQKTHLVPKLKIGKDIQMLDEQNAQSISPAEAEEETEEYLLPDDFNIFPLVEKFTVRHHTKDMQYWACVVMRNLCRKDDARGGIRQCAYYECGKWEEYQRQFAKCRRCRRTKYCSKECQKSAWVYHRHWCHSSP
ncbi:hypothetical protein FQN57_004303 [Myotisia sp. PD_48]|nr:hypothetical protein FQN57_004303 [Myotisia sp. PD_48]